MLRGTGVESEVELPFAVLHQLRRPVLDRLDRLPAPRADALRGAFGLADVESGRLLAELRASGETARRRNPSTCGQLTPREQQVAELAGEGLSNREIADRLFLSRHTVGYHLHKVDAKLEITSRANLRRVR